MMKKITIIMVLIITTLIFTGCSGKGGNGDINGTVGISVPSCGTGTDKGRSVAISVNDKTIQKTEDGAQLRLWHYPNGDKFGCMITGEANLTDN